ncbi:uncharacterized protein GGS22DRAFT_145281 [Annulohypoxylon maeteangense]|uniref:uncharacterized protein n=1 Tax=Annulohypoxylon maeteangense TaxID=1927788 RepID=UPI002008B92E|nr:uncharacterized protein GGS22DRAFT_145281 [Annulohypoxylon maeteangense]KAI0884645.1 hypothetical protein GGS22DRAFT_145281 [Annulohypoxylon maeteangense]
MNQQGTGAEQARRPTPPSVRRYIASIDRVVGGRPAKDASKEVWDDYINKFMTEMNREQNEEAEKSWTQLAKGEQFIEKMGKQPFRLLGNSSDEDEGVPSTTPAKKRSHTERSRTTPKNDSRKGAHHVEPAADSDEYVPSADDEAAASLTAIAQTQLSAQSPENPSPTQAGTKPKRRRTGLESLESSLGKNWEAMVDEEGHRPARRTRKK